MSHLAHGSSCTLMSRCHVPPPPLSLCHCLCRSLVAHLDVEASLRKSSTLPEPCCALLAEDSSLCCFFSASCLGFRRGGYTWKSSWALVSSAQQAAISRRVNEARTHHHNSNHTIIRVVVGGIWPHTHTADSSAPHKRDDTQRPPPCQLPGAPPAATRHLAPHAHPPAPCASRQ